MTALQVFNALEPLARATIGKLDGEPYAVVTLILNTFDKVKATQPTDDLALAEKFAAKALPHLQAVLPQAGVVGSIVAVTIDLAEFLIDAAQAPATGEIAQPCGDDGLPLPVAGES